MEKLSAQIEKILVKRFAKDSLIALATAADNVPHVRTVDAYYDGGSFYVLTHALSGKMRQIGENPNVAISGDWFTASGTGINLGWFCREENRAIADRMRTLFAAWIDNGHNDFADENTVILRIQLTRGVLVADNRWIEIDFTESL